MNTTQSLLKEIEQMESFLLHINDEKTKQKALHYTKDLYNKYEKHLAIDEDRKTILVDMDEVLADLITPWLNTYNQDYNDTLSVSDLTDFNTSLFTKPECGSKVYDYFKTPGFFRYLEPVPFAKEFIQSLYDAKYRVLIVSDSPKGNSYCEYEENSSLAGNPADDKRAWLANHFPMIPSSDIIFTSQKWFVQGDVIIDDKPSTFLEFQKRGRHAILIDQPYNRHISTPFRAKGLKEAKELVFKLLQDKEAVCL